MKPADYVTMLNLVSGFFSLYFAFSGEYVLAAVLIILGAFFDYIDGKVARFTSSSKIGAELDSLADLVTFGVAPAFLVLALNQAWIAFVLSTLLICGGAYRLARFNIQNKYFGMPITVNGIVIPVLVLLSAPVSLMWAYMGFAFILMIGRFKFPLSHH